MGRNDFKDEYNVIISEAARQLLVDHIRFLALADQDAARKIKIMLMDTIRSLSRLPARHPFIAADFLPANKYHKMVADKRYMILYQVKERTVFVDWIIDCRQDYKWLFIEMR